MRLRIQCPAVYGNVTLEQWVQPKSIPRGLNHVPSIGDNVNIIFKEGDVNFPFWEYAGYQIGKGVSQAAENYPNRFVYATPSGNFTIYDDGNNTITIQNREGQKVILSDKLFAGSSNDSNLGALINRLFLLINEATTATALGPQPFINLLEFEELRQDFNNLLSDGT